MKKLSLLMLVVFCLPVSVAIGQGNGGGNNNGNAGGIRIDVEGVVTPQFSRDPTGQLTLKRRMAAALQNLPADMNRESALRSISLVRLEKEYRRLQEQGEAVPPEMFYLAGLQRIDYIFVYPESRDIVIAGPAEGFAPDDLGRTVGVKSHRPAIRLDDLIVALRAVATVDFIGCSIDPVPERIVDLQRYIKANSGATTVARAQAKYQEMANVLGLQTISVFGVPEDTHFAQSLVEADIRMKLISIGLQDPRVRGFKSHLAFLRPNGNSMQRWWFIPLYDAFQKSADGNAYRLLGQRAQLLTEDEVTDARGERSAAPTTQVSTAAYAKHFTAKFPQLAEAVPAFAELQNLFDLCIAASIVREKGLADRVGWKMDVFLNQDVTVVPSADVPKQIPSSYAYKSSRGMLLGQVSGGVTFRLKHVVRDLSIETESSGELQQRAVEAGGERARPEAHVWWWD